MFYWERLKPIANKYKCTSERACCSWTHGRPFVQILYFCIMTSQCVVVSWNIHVANHDDYCPPHTSQPCCLFQCSPVPTHLALSCRPTSRPTITRADDKRPLHSAEGESRAPACMVFFAKRAYSLFSMAKYLVDYQAPVWAQKLKNVPKHKVEVSEEFLSFWSNLVWEIFSKICETVWVDRSIFKASLQPSPATKQRRHRLVFYQYHSVFRW